MRRDSISIPKKQYNYKMNKIEAVRYFSEKSCQPVLQEGDFVK
jgi:hypothetical protein